MCFFQVPNPKPQTQFRYSFLVEPPHPPPPAPNPTQPTQPHKPFSLSSSSSSPPRSPASRPIVLARELTKLHEEIFRGTLKEATDRYGGAGPKDPRGEFTVVLGPRDANRAAGGAGDGAVVLEAR